MTDAIQIMVAALDAAGDERTVLGVNETPRLAQHVLEALTTAGLLATPEHDAAVRRAVLEPIEQLVNEHRDDAVDDRVLDEAVRWEGVAAAIRAALAAPAPGADDAE